MKTTELSIQTKDQIVTYLCDRLEKKKKSLSEFGEITGIPSAYFTWMKKRDTYHKMGERVWGYLWGIYKDDQINMVLDGAWIKYERKHSNPSKKKTRNNKEIPSNNEPIIPDKKELVTVKTKVVESLKSNHQPVTHTLKKSEITLGEAIDVLIKHGAKFTMTLEK